MRGYVPVPASLLGGLIAQRELPGPLRVCVVDPAWRAGAPEVDEEEWEFEAQTSAAAPLGGAGVILAIDVDPPAGAAIDDGWVEVRVRWVLRDVAAVLTADLAWYGVQELPDLVGNLPAG